MPQMAAVEQVTQNQSFLCAASCIHIAERAYDSVVIGMALSSNYHFGQGAWLHPHVMAFDNAI